jgi:hypothetical protein
LLRIIRLTIVGGPPAWSFAAGFTDATSNCGPAAGVCATKPAPIKPTAAHTTHLKLRRSNLI